MLVIQAFRADRLLAMASVFVATVLGESFQQQAEQELDLADIVNTEVRGVWQGGRGGASSWCFGVQSYFVLCRACAL